MSDATLNAMATAYCGQLKSFVTCLDSNTTQLRTSMSQKPPAYADLSSFLLDFNDRAAEDAAELDVLEEMTVENVSFQELLANCMQLYKQNEAGITLLESQLEQFGYVKVGETENAEERQALEMTFVEDLKQRVRFKDKPKEFCDKESIENKEDIMTVQHSDLLSSSSSSGRYHSQSETAWPPSTTGSARAHLGAVNSPLPSAVALSKLDIEEMSMIGESFSLEDFGLSASSLASLARIDLSTPDKAESPADKQQQPTCAGSLTGNGTDNINSSYSPSTAMTPSSRAQGNKSRSMSFLGLVSNEEYAQVFPWLRRRVSLQELNEAIAKINESMLAKQNGIMQGDKSYGKVLEIEDSILLGLGSNMKACLLFLVQIDRLVMACNNGRTTYRPSELEKFR